jgi:HEAT repeat protein
LPELRVALRDADFVVQINAAHAMGKLGPAVLPELRMALRRSDGLVRAILASAFRKTSVRIPYARNDSQNEAPDLIQQQYDALQRELLAIAESATTEPSPRSPVGK